MSAAYASRIASAAASGPTARRGVQRSYSIPFAARNSATDRSSLSVRLSAGILTSTMLALPLQVPGGPDRLEQELERLDLLAGLREILTPRVEPVSPDEEPVRARVAPQGLLDPPGENLHVLRVLDDRKPLPVLVRLHPRERLEHLVSL